VSIDGGREDLAVHIDLGLCCGFGNCAQISPTLFMLDAKSNRASLIRAPLAEEFASIDQAVTQCPTQAISARFSSEHVSKDYSP